MLKRNRVNSKDDALIVKLKKLARDRINGGGGNTPDRAYVSSSGGANAVELQKPARDPIPGESGRTSICLTVGSSNERVNGVLLLKNEPIDRRTQLSG
jgi:hypothetical protein